MDETREFEHRFKNGGREKLRPERRRIRPFRGAAPSFRNADEAAARADRAVEAGENPRCRVRNGNLHDGPSSGHGREVAEHLRDRHQRTDAPAGEGTMQIFAGGLFHPGRRGKPFGVFQRIVRRDFLHGLDLSPARVRRIAAAGEPPPSPGRGCCRSVTTRGCSTKRGTTRSGRRFPTRNTGTGPSRSGNSFRASNRCRGRGPRESITVSRSAVISCSTSCRSPRNLPDFFRRSRTSNGSRKSATCAIFLRRGWTRFSWGGSS